MWSFFACFIAITLAAATYPQRSLQKGVYSGPVAASIKPAGRILLDDEKPIAEEPTAEDTTAEDTISEDTAAEDTIPEDTILEDATAEDAIPEDTTAEDTTAEDTTAEETTPEDTTVEDTTAEDTTSEDTTVEDTTTEETTPEDTTAEDTSPEDTTAEDTTAEEPTTTVAEPSACGIPVSSFYMTTCPNTTALPLPGITDSCEPSSSLQVDSDYGTTLTCNNTQPVMVVYGKSYDGVTEGFWFLNALFCDEANDQYWSGSAYWNKNYKFNPQIDKIVCMPGGFNMRNTYFRRTQCTGYLNAILAVPANCPTNFSTLSLYTPSTNSAVAIDSTLASILSAGCTSTTTPPFFDERNFPESGFTCRNSFYLVQGSNVIHIKNLLCGTSGFTAIGIDDSQITVNPSTDTVFCTKTHVSENFACPSLTPVTDCPTLANITQYTADTVPVPFYSSGLLTSNPQCLQNYTLYRSGPQNYKLTCYQPGTDLDGDKETYRMLMLVSYQGTYHLTRSLVCSDTLLAIDEQLSHVLQPGATFTCVDRLTAYDALLLTQGNDVSGWDYGL